MGRELRVPVSKQVSTLGQQIASATGQVPRGLSHPFIGWVGRDAADVDFTGSDVDEEEYIMGDESEDGPDFGGEEVGGQQAVGMGLDEVGPACFARAAWRGIDAVRFENVLDGLMAKVVSQFLHRAGDSEVAPCGILTGEFDDLFNNYGIRGRAADGFDFVPIGRVELFGDKLPMPPKNCLRRDDGGDIIKGLFAKLFSDDGQCDALTIAQAWTAGNLIAQDSILGGEVFDLEAKFTVDLSGNPRKQFFPAHTQNPPKGGVR